MLGQNSHPSATFNLNSSGNWHFYELIFMLYIFWAQKEYNGYKICFKKCLIFLILKGTKILKI